jgi:hypothetical protein
VYRDSIAGQWTFSPYVDLGVPLEGATAILIDDGSNTGDTLTGLLAAALSGPAPAELLVLVAVSRLSAHRAMFFHNLSKLGPSSVRVIFFTRLDLPVYSAHSCGICRFARSVSEVVRVVPTLAPRVRDVHDHLHAIDSTSEQQFLFRFSDLLSVGKLREAIERVAYDSGALGLLSEQLTLAMDERDSRPLLNLAFIAATEPDALITSVIVPSMYQLLSSFVDAVSTCPYEDLATYVSAIARCMLRYFQRGADVPQTVARSVWLEILSRTDMTPRGLGVCLVLVLAAASDGSESDARMIANAWVAELANAAARADSRGLLEAFALLYARDAERSRRVSLLPTPMVVANASTYLFALAADVAADFWAHASDTIRRLVAMIVESSSKRGKGSLEDTISKIANKLAALLELKTVLETVDEDIHSHSGDSTGALAAWGPEVDRSLTAMITALVDVSRPSRGVEARHLVDAAANQLASSWEKLKILLDPFFMELFPSLSDLRKAWAASADGLPHHLIGPIQGASGNHRVFMPRSILERFVRDSVQNTLTYAFPGERRDDSRARIAARVRSEVLSDDEYMVLEIWDTGPELGNANVSSGHGFALDHLRRLVEPFNGRVEGPASDGRQTVVRLRMRKKESAPNASA